MFVDLDNPEVREKLKKRYSTDHVPSFEEIESWVLEDGGCEATDGCWVEPDGTCPHGCDSWLLVLGLI